MSEVSKTTEDDALIFRFLAAAQERITHHANRLPMNSKEANVAISWLRGCVGKLQDDGTLR